MNTPQLLLKVFLLSQKLTHSFNVRIAKLPLVMFLNGGNANAAIGCAVSGQYAGTSLDLRIDFRQPLLPLFTVGYVVPLFPR